MDTLNWFMTHWVEIAKAIGELTAAIIALTTSIIGLCSILVNKVIPILAADHPALPFVKAIAKIALNTPPVKPEDRPVSTPSTPTSGSGPALTILLACLFIAGCASVTYKDGKGKQFTYTRLGAQSIKGFSVNQTGDNTVVSVESAQSDTQALSSAVDNLSNLAVKAAK